MIDDAKRIAAMLEDARRAAHKAGLVLITEDPAVYVTTRDNLTGGVEVAVDGRRARQLGKVST